MATESMPIIYSWLDELRFCISISVACHDSLVVALSSFSFIFSSSFYVICLSILWPRWQQYLRWMNCGNSKLPTCVLSDCFAVIYLKQPKSTDCNKQFSSWITFHMFLRLHVMKGGRSSVAGKTMLKKLPLILERATISTCRMSVFFFCQRHSSCSCTSSYYCHCHCHYCRRHCYCRYYCYYQCSYYWQYCCHYRCHCNYHYQCHYYCWCSSTTKYIFLKIKP